MIIMGPQGSGKGTIGLMIAEKYNIPIISTGDLFRNAMAKGTDLGVKAKEYVNKGIIVPDEITNPVLLERLQENDCKEGFILDGYPRKMAQAEFLEKNMVKIDVVIYLNASKDIIMESLSNRLTCKKCGAIYNTKHVPPKKPGVCDKCSGELYQREDETPAAVKQRLELYEKETKPVIVYYKKKGILREVDASLRVPKIIFDRVMRALKD